MKDDQVKVLEDGEISDEMGYDYEDEDFAWSVSYTKLTLRRIGDVEIWVCWGEER